MLRRRLASAALALASCRASAQETPRTPEWRVIADVPRGDSLARLPRYAAPHAHSVAVDPATHLVYVPLENVGGKPVLRILSLE